MSVVFDVCAAKFKFVCDYYVHIETWDSNRAVLSWN